jgi:plastocyanin
MRPNLRTGSGALALILACAACGGDGYNAPPTSPSPPPAGSTAISIVGDRGNQSFNPNPGSAQSGMASWRNADTVVHRIVSNDGTFDTGDIAPGATSSARAVASSGMNYHCSIHPGMIGAINAAAGPPPPCTGIYC